MIKTGPFDAAQYLDTLEDVIDFLAAAIAGGDTGHIAIAVAIVARARAKAEVAKEVSVRGILENKRDSN